MPRGEKSFKKTISLSFGRGEVVGEMLQIEDSF
jgi:hypothetical protein